MTTSYPKRLIEVDLPIKRISAHARREKSIRHGHISTLHIWWARRPLAACRAVILGALWPDPGDPNCPERFRKEARERVLAWARDSAAKASAESFDRLMRVQKDASLLEDPLELRNCLLDFIADFANWDNSNDPAFLETSRALVQVAHEALGATPGTRPLVVDPFAGGGAIPLEALRVGADVFASDLNPVAVLLNKVVLEYIPRYGQRLADEVRKWGECVKKEAEKQLADFYPKDPDGATPIAYLWARTITCEGPGCGAEVPLIRSLWLSKKRGRYAAVKIVASKRTKEIGLSLVEPTAVGELPERGTSVGGAAVCPVCEHATSVERVRAQLGARRGGAADARLIAVVVSRPSTDGRAYRAATPGDEDAFRRASDALLRLTETPRAGMPAVPDGGLNHLRGFFNVVLYGMTRWGDLFSPRQALALVVFSDLVRGLAARLAVETDRQMAVAIQTCLAIVVDRQAEKLSSLARWDTSRENAQGTFGRQALPMVWDFCEANPFSGAGGDWDTAVDWVARVVEGVGAIGVGPIGVGQATRASATAGSLPADSASAVITDPPYYAAVPYADLSDFFYEWLRRSLAGLHSDLLTNELTPKTEELVSLAHRAAMYREKDGLWFERGMQKACEEGRRVCMPSGLGVYVFASKETPAWEAMLAALIDAGWVVSASWPIDTEMGSRLRARDSATLASSVHIVCRPRENPDGSLRTDAVGDWRDILAELPKRIHEWMPRLSEEGVVGADAIFACLGPALEVFSRYSRVEKASGELVTLKEYLEHVWAAVAKEALSMIFAGAETSGLEEDARLTAMWLWTLSTGGGNGKADASTDEEESEEDEDDGKAGKKAKLAGFALEYDAARKIAQGLGAHIEGLTSLVEVKGETARLLPVGERTRALFGKSEAEAPTPRRKKKVQQMKLGFAEDLEEAEETGAWGQKGVPQLGQTVLDRVHQSMILFAAGRGEALRRFLVDESAGRDARFWRLAQALAALYPTGTDERRWVEGVLARKKSLGL